MKNFFLLSVIVFSFSVVNYGQCDETNESDQKNCENLQRLRELRKKNEVILESEQLFVPTLTNRLPGGENAWIVSVIRSGGWAGPSNQLIATVKSDGNYLCHKEDKLLNFQIQKEKFEPISQLFDKISFSFYQNSFDDNDNDLAEKPVFAGYNQSSIATTTLIIVKRETVLGKKNKKQFATNAYRFKMVDFPNETSVIRQIYDSTIATANCDNAS
jgi:hypothetical protein